jgi:hypothetical protein
MLANIVCIDFEASSLDERGFPIEAAIAEAATGQVRAWLIRPTPAWLDHGDWSAEAEALHGLALARVTAEGRPVAEVAREIAAALVGKRALSDNPGFDAAWLAALLAAAGEPVPARQLDDFTSFAHGLAARQGRRTDIALAKAQAEAWSRFPHQHRAGSDARRNAEVLRQIVGTR